MFYGSVDAGIKLVRGPDFHVGAFVGYHFLRDYVDAMGCTQIATHPDICVPSIPSSVRGISQTNNWHSLRLGLEGSVRVRPALEAQRSTPPGYPTRGCSAPTCTCCGSAATSATSPGRSPRTARAGATSSMRLCPTASMTGSALVPAAATGTSRAKGHTHFEGRVVGINAEPQVVHWQADHSAASSRPISSSVRTLFTRADPNGDRFPGKSCTRGLARVPTCLRPAGRGELGRHGPPAARHHQFLERPESRDPDRSRVPAGNRRFSWSRSRSPS